MTLRRAHFCSALIIAVFLAMHIGNHLTIFSGAKAHIAVMQDLRLIYRGLVFESLLLVAIIFQICSGALMVWRRRTEEKTGVAKLQMASGLYILLFLIIHVSAVMAGRASGVDTNIYFAVAGYYNGLAWFFTPYYFLSVAALFAHLGCAVYWAIGAEKAAARTVLIGMLAAGILLAGGLTVTMGGWVTSIAVPASYLG